MESPSEISRIVKVSIPSELGYEKIPRNVANTLAQRMGFSGERIEDLMVSVAEAVTNSIEHNPSPDAGLQEVVVIFWLKARSLVIKVIDQGPPPVELPPELLELIHRRPIPPGIDLWVSPLCFADEVKTRSSSEGNEIELTFHLRE